MTDDRRRDSDEATSTDLSYPRKALVASAVGYGVDGMDNLTLGFALAAISVELGITPAESGSLATVTLVGAVVGGIVFGILGDRLGRVKALSISIVLFAVFTGVSALAQGYVDLAFYRFIAGIGLGGEFGVGMALVAEAWPAKWRARATSWVGVGGQAGVLIGTLLAGPIVASWGWRALFALGAVPAIVAFFIRRHVAEPEIFTQDAATRKKNRFTLRLLFTDRQTTKISLALVVLCSVQTFGYYGIMTWLPTYLADRFGFTLTKSGVWTAVTIVGMAIGMLVFGTLADRIGRRRTFWTYQLGAVISVLVYSQISDPVTLLWCGPIMGFFVNGMLGGYGALMAELYPTEARATAENVLFNIGRLIGGTAPIVFALIADSASLAVAIGFLSVLYVIDMFVMLAIPERRGAPLRSSADDRSSAVTQEEQP